MPYVPGGGGSSSSGGGGGTTTVVDGFGNTSTTSASSINNATVLNTRLIAVEDKVDFSEANTFFISLGGNPITRTGKSNNPYPNTQVQQAYTDIPTGQSWKMDYLNGPFPVSPIIDKANITNVLSDGSVLGSASSTITYGPTANRIRWQGKGRLYGEIINNTTVNNAYFVYQDCNLTNSSLTETTPSVHEFRGSLDGDNFNVTVDNPNAIISVQWVKSFGKITLNSGKVEICGIANPVPAAEHKGGKIVLSHIRPIANASGNIFESDANQDANNVVVFGPGINRIQADGSIGKINKTGNCDYYVNGFIPNYDVDIINGKLINDDGQKYESFLTNRPLAINVPLYKFWEVKDNGNTYIALPPDATHTEAFWQQVGYDFNEIDNLLLTKQDKIIPQTVGNLQGLDTEGNSIDSFKIPSDSTDTDDFGDDDKLPSELRIKDYIENLPPATYKSFIVQEDVFPSTTVNLIYGDGTPVAKGTLDPVPPNFREQGFDKITWKRIGRFLEATISFIQNGPAIPQTTRELAAATNYLSLPGGVQVDETLYDRDSIIPTSDIKFLNSQVDENAILNTIKYDILPAVSVSLIYFYMAQDSIVSAGGSYPLYGDQANSTSGSSAVSASFILPGKTEFTGSFKVPIVGWEDYEELPIEGFGNNQQTSNRNIQTSSYTLLDTDGTVSFLLSEDSDATLPSISEGKVVPLENLFGSNTNILNIVLPSDGKGTTIEQNKNSLTAGQSINLLGIGNIWRISNFSN